MRSMDRVYIFTASSDTATEVSMRMKWKLCDVCTSPGFLIIHLFIYYWYLIYQDMASEINKPYSVLYVIGHWVSIRFYSYVIIYF